MPKQFRHSHFVIVCSDAELREQLTVCENSDYRVARDRDTGGVTVYDGGTAMLRAEPFGGGWLVWCQRDYYRHPFQHPGGGDALPGAR